MSFMILMMVLSASGSTSPGSMLTQVLLSISATGVSEHGVDDCAAETPGERPLGGLLTEGILCPLKSSSAMALLGVASWLLLKDLSTRTLLKS